ncbi:uncharacterized protein CBL_07055 [Carabus blaptoides fortunei]
MSTDYSISLHVSPGVLYNYSTAKYFLFDSQTVNKALLVWSFIQTDSSNNFHMNKQNTIGQQVLLGMSIEVHGRPVERTRRSAEDIIAGVDFLSVFMKSANDRSARNYSNKITTSPSTETTQSSTEINESTTFTHIDDTPTTIQNIDQETKTNKPVTIESSTDKSTTETIPVTLVSFETNTEIHEIVKVRRGKNKGREELKLESSKVVVSVENPSAIVAEARKSDFSIDESEPIVVDTNHSPNDGVKFKTKPEDLVAIGANPDYIAQQNARIQGITNYNQPYGNRNPSSRGRSVSYSAVVQVLPHPHAAKSWKQEDESIRSSNRQRGNTPVSTSKDYNTNSDVDYDYTESYQDYNDKQNSTKAQSTPTNSRQGDAVAESKDYYVTRKYNTGELNGSGDKHNRNGKQDSSIEKKHVEPTERNWGIPEKNYEIPESNHHTSPTVYGRPEENYEIDETISVMTNGRAHGVQGDLQAKLDDKPLQIKVGQTPVKPDDNQKIGYVVEGRNYRKYRVEERTSDGFIVGEYGVVSNNDGSLRGVRYTADGTTNPRLIYDALMKFLSL